jgi:hypothetical protein
VQIRSLRGRLQVNGCSSASVDAAMTTVLAFGG